MRRINLLKNTLFLALSALVLTACPPRDKNILERVDLFFIKPGKLFNELDYFHKENQQLNGYSRIFMKEGLFYITDSGAGKVMEMTSYGDVLGIIYNPAQTPPPPETVTDQESESNRKVNNWVFRSIFSVGVTDDHILVGDTLPENRAVWNEEKQINQTHVILRFNRNGEYMDYLGQEGVGTVPFPFVNHLAVRPDGEVVVTTRSEEQWTLYWFGANGNLRYRIEMKPENLPAYGKDRQPSLIRILPDPSKEILLLQVDYIPIGPDAGEPGPESRFYKFSLKDKTYDKGISLPDNVMVFNKKQYSVPYLYLGTIRNGFHYFLSPREPDLYTLLIINDKSEVKARRQIRIPDSDLVYNDLYLTPDGILTMIAFMNNGALVSWWRSDRLAGVHGATGGR